jgi:hypothetical protein
MGLAFADAFICGKSLVSFVRGISGLAFYKQCPNSGHAFMETIQLYANSAREGYGLKEPIHLRKRMKFVFSLSIALLG